MVKTPTNVISAQISVSPRVQASAVSQDGALIAKLRAVTLAFSVIQSVFVVLPRWYENGCRTEVSLIAHHFSLSPTSVPNFASEVGQLAYQRTILPIKIDPNPESIESLSPAQR
jgi:hypothetical protein